MYPSPPSSSARRSPARSRRRGPCARRSWPGCTALGVTRQLTGELEGAAIALAEARDIYQDVGSRLGSAEVNNALGVLLLHQGQTPTALEHHNAALHAANEAQNSLEEANALRGIASCLHALDKPAESISHLRQALEIYSAHVKTTESRNTSLIQEGSSAAFRSVPIGVVRTVGRWRVR
ncbi:tetratricopeptide repeat protein [Phytohabitans kaempferiae]|uniref:Tetratricopeptide repeat protein n=1 Tax=Phytohabitans kaempferiae TaxID=1620943 RepID=A0ABV6MCD4_9ACTN